MQKVAYIKTAKVLSNTVLLFTLFFFFWVRFEKALYSIVKKNPNLLFNHLFQFLTFLYISHSLDRLTVMDVGLRIRTTHLCFAHIKNIFASYFFFPEKINVLINHSTLKCLGTHKQREYSPCSLLRNLCLGLTG